MHTIAFSIENGGLRARGENFFDFRICHGIKEFGTRSGLISERCVPEIAKRRHSNHRGASATGFDASEGVEMIGSWRTIAPVTPTTASGGEACHAARPRLARPVRGVILELALGPRDGMGKAPSNLVEECRPVQRFEFKSEDRVRASRRHRGRAEESVLGVYDDFPASSLPPASLPGYNGSRPGNLARIELRYSVSLPPLLLGQWSLVIPPRSSSR